MKDQLDESTEARLARIWKKAYDAKTRDDLQALYADWAGSYDADHAAIGFFAHRTAADLLQQHLPPAGCRVLDAGAGTGHAGVELAKRGFADIVALDFSAHMLERASQKGVYQSQVQADLSEPLDALDTDAFDGAILVGVFSYGQAPAHALDEIVRVVRPGGKVVFTMRTDFYEQDAMGVKSHMTRLGDDGVWQQVEVTASAQYLPGKDPDAMFRAFCFEVKRGQPAVSDAFRDAVRAAFSGPRPTRALDHVHIWDAAASRLYNAYIEADDYYLPDSEEEILRTHGAALLGPSRFVVELGCGSARKITHLLSHLLQEGEQNVVYAPIDVSDGALADTKQAVEGVFGDKVKVRPLCGTFDDKLSEIAPDIAKTMLFFGGSIGNFETIEDTVAFLRSLRDRMTERDRLIIGFDLDKDRDVLLRAYNAGERNRSFFVHMVRRMNHLLGANFDVCAFDLASTYEPEAPVLDVQSALMRLQVKSTRAQSVHIPALDLRVELAAGDTIGVGLSRKFTTEGIRALATAAGLSCGAMYFDQREWFCLADFCRDDAAPSFVV